MIENKKLDLMSAVLEYSNPKLLNEINLIKDDKGLKMSPHYEFALNEISELQDIYSLKILRPLFCNIDLLWSKYYEFTLLKLINIKDYKRLNELINLAISVDLLNSKYYTFAINKACKVKKYNMLIAFINIELNKFLLNSKYYKYILNKLVYLNNLEIFDKLSNILNLLDHQIFEEQQKVIKTIIDILNNNNKENIIHLLNIYYFKLQNKINKYNELQDKVKCKIFVKNMKKNEI